MKKLIYFAISFLLILVSGCEKNKNSIEKWGVFEEEFKYEHSGNPYTEIELFATFSNGEEEKRVRGFYDDNAVFKVRFMPHKTGQWEYKTESNIADLDGITGSFECIKPGPGNYGPVRVARRYHFENDTPEILDADLQSQVSFKAEIIDTWNMSVEKLNESYHGEVSIPLPSKPYIAVRLIKDDFIFPVKPLKVISDGNLFYRDIKVDFQHHRPEGIRYTLDGSEPGPDSRKYTGSFTIDANTTLKSVVIDGERKSIITEVDFKKADLMPALDIANPEPGFAWKSYLGEWTELPNFRWLRPESKGRTKEINLDMAPADDYFGMTFTGYIEIPYDEVYSFFAFSDDGSAIYIDGKLVTLNDGQHGAREERGQVGLEAGIHKIEVHYFDNWYEEVLEVYVSAPGMERQNINSMVVLY
jgi:hypothetical protein